MDYTWKLLLKKNNEIEVSFGYKNIKFKEWIDIFNSRLKEFGLNILVILGIITAMVLFGSVGYFLDSKINISDEVGMFMIKVLAILVWLYVFYKIITNVIKFINWLFIEPFKKNKGE